MLNKIKIIITLILLNFAILSQEDDTLWFLDKPISSFEYEGLITKDKAEFNELLKSFTNQNFTDKLFEEINEILYSLEYFDSIEAEAQEYRGSQDKMTILFNFKEKPSISSLEITGNINIRKSEILDVIESKEGDIFSKPKLNYDIEEIKKLYLDKGYENIDVSFDEKDISKKGILSKQVTIKVSESKQTIIKEIRFSGNKNISNGDLIKQLESKIKGIINQGIFKEENLEKDKEAIIKRYIENGYLDAEVLKADVVLDKEEETNSFIILNFYINENKQWSFGEIEFKNNEIFTDKELKKFISLKKGEILNGNKLDKIKQSIIGTYVDRGYLTNGIEFQPVKDEKKKVINYKVILIENGRSYVEDITVEGNTKTKKYVITREIPLKKGDVFSRVELQNAYRQLYSLKYFNNVEIIPIQGSNPRLIKLIVKVEEKNTISPEVGLSFGGEGTIPINLNLGASEINFLGSGMTLGGSTKLSWSSQSVSLNYGTNWLDEYRISLGLNFTFTRNTATSLAQDALFPIFNKNQKNKVPDPYKGYYVFAKDTEYNGKTYKEGELFPFIPNAEDIKKYNLTTDYIYDSSNLSNEYKLDYENLNLSVGFNIGYTFLIPVIKNIFIGTGMNLGWDRINYPASAGRPFEFAIYENRGLWAFIPRNNLGLVSNGREGMYSYDNGHYFLQNFSFVYGKTRRFFQSDTKFQYYFTLFNLYVSDSWSWKMVLALNSDISLMTGLGSGENNFIPGNEILGTNGVTLGRGWNRVEGEITWNNWIELRMPLVESIFWFDMYFEAVNVTPTLDDFLKTGLEDWYFSLGAGLRFTIPGFPIKIYLGKTFKLEPNGKAVWQKGNLFATDKEGSGVSLIFSMSMD